MELSVSNDLVSEDLISECKPSQRIGVDSMDSSFIDSNVFWVEQSAREENAPGWITWLTLKFTDLSGVTGMEKSTISSAAVPKPQNKTLELESNDPTRPNAKKISAPFSFMNLKF